MRLARANRLTYAWPFVSGIPTVIPDGALDKELVPDARRNAEVAALLESLRLRKGRGRLDVLVLAWGALTAVEGALIGTLFTSPSKQSLLTTVAVGLGLIVVGMFFYMWQLHRRLVVNDALVPADYYFQLKDAVKVRTALERSVLNLTTWVQFQHTLERDVSQFEEYCHAQLRHKAQNDEALATVRMDFEQRFVGILMGVVDEMENRRAALLNYEPENEIYFFDIFELGKDDRLHVVARKCTPGATTHLRSWGVGEGEVGDCIYQKASILRDRSSILSARRDLQWKETDNSYFIRRISTPIRATDGRQFGAYGAICITSSNPARFTADDCRHLENIAQPLAALFQRRDAAYASIEKRSKHDQKSNQSADISMPVDGGVS